MLSIVAIEGQAVGQSFSMSSFVMSTPEKRRALKKDVLGDGTMRQYLGSFVTIPSKLSIRH